MDGHNRRVSHHIIILTQLVNKPCYLSSSVKHLNWHYEEATLFKNKQLTGRAAVRVSITRERAGQKL